MAARKPAVKAPSTSLTLWEEEMAGAAVAQGAAEKPMGFNSSISFRGGIMSVDGNMVEGNELDCVILTSMYENQYYTKAFDPNAIQTPDCYAFSEPDADPEGMAPHAEVGAESKQGDDNGLCANCWANEMGSADVGRGKACKNVKRIVVVPADALVSVEAMEAAEMRVAKIPVMSVKNLSGYIKNKLAEEVKRPTWGVVTTMKVVPDQKSQFKVLFSFQELISFDQGLYDALKAKIQEAKTSIGNPYPKFAEGEAPVAPPKKGQRGVPGRAPAAKKAAGRKF